MSKPFDPTKPVQQRNGRPAKIITTDGRLIIGEEPHPIYAEIQEANGKWSLAAYRADGSYWGADKPNALSDLINIPKTKKVKFWVNVYKDDTIGGVCNDKETADASAYKSRFACICIEREVQEGEGL